MMIAVEKIIARATSAVASRNDASARRCARSNDCMMFSVTITAALAIRPKSMAPREIRFAGTPNQFMPLKDTHNPSGMMAATMSAMRRLPRNSHSTMSTRQMPRSSVCVTVRTVRLSSSWRS